jgi:SAM-dependent methyltransferase
MSRGVPTLLSLGIVRCVATLKDIGCGSGLSGEELTEEGHVWIGCDIAPSMLEVAAERDIEGDLCQHDMGHGLPFKAGTFDGVISVSVWCSWFDQNILHSRMLLGFTMLLGLTPGMRRIQLHTSRMSLLLPVTP